MANHRQGDGGQTGVHGAEEVGGSAFPRADLSLAAGDGVAGGCPVELLAVAAAVGEFGSGVIGEDGKDSIFPPIHLTPRYPHRR